MVPTGSALREGETVDVRFDPVDLYPFSPDTGELLSKPDPDGSESLSKPKPE